MINKKVSNKKVTADETKEDSDQFEIEFNIDSGPDMGMCDILNYY